MKRVAALATVIILLHLLANGLHGRSHAQARVPLESWQQVFVGLTVFAFPIVAGILYWTPLRRWGAALLGGTMLASVAFGIYFHFIGETTDHVAYRQADPVGRFFVATAVLLVPAGCLGAGFGAWSWNQLRNGRT